MKLLLFAFAAGCVLPLALAPQSNPPRQTYRITGVVVNGATRQPLSRARVLMHPAEDRSKQTETTTGNDGKFAFEGLPAGMWSLYAERKGFLRRGFGQRPGVPDSFTQVMTGPDGASENLTFPLDAPAVIAGRVSDEAGEPVPAALQIIAELETGTRQYQRIQNAATDELGEFRIADLPAIRCYLLVVTPTPPAADSQQAPPTFAPTYYPNATDPRAATLLELEPGREYRADFILRRSRGVAIHITGELRASVVILSAEGPRGSEAIVAQIDPSEGRSFYNIPPGRHKLTLFDQRTGDQSSKRIAVGTQDVTVEAPFRASAAISARVRLENADPDLLPKVTFFAHADGDYQTYARTVAPDGTLTMAGMASGRYKFMLATSGLYIKSMTTSNGHVQDGIVELPEEGTVAIDVVLAGDGGHITGKLRSKGKPVAPARVVLAPRTPSSNSVDYRSYQTESDGSFSYSAVKPGEYILFATTDWKLEFGNPDAVRELVSSGQRVRVEAKRSTDVQLELPGASHQ